MSPGRKTLAVLILVLPLVSFVVSNGGLPICCWGGMACPAHASMAGACPMTGMSAGAHCQMAPVEHLILPAPALPLFASPSVTRGVPAAIAFSPVARPAAAVGLAGWALAIFHPPHSVAQ